MSRRKVKFLLKETFSVDFFQLQDFTTEELFRNVFKEINLSCEWEDFKTALTSNVFDKSVGIHSIAMSSTKKTEILTDQDPKDMCLLKHTHIKTHLNIHTYSWYACFRPLTCACWSACWRHALPFLTQHITQHNRKRAGRQILILEEKITVT